MMRANTHRGLRGARGFSLIELTLVIIVMGILAAAIVPMITGQVGRAQADAERTRLKALRDVLLADAVEKGGFVDSISLNPLAYLLMFPGGQANQFFDYNAQTQSLGVPVTSVYNNATGVLSSSPPPVYTDNKPSTYLYEVRSTLNRSALTSSNPRLEFCQNAVAALNSYVAATDTGTRVCLRPTNSLGSTVRCADDAGSSLDLAAAVIASRGKNRVFDFENGETTTGATPDTLHVFEAPSRGINLSSDVGAYYDDSVEYISVAEVVKACQDRGILNVTCQTGQRQIRLTNAGPSAIGYQLNGGACTALAANTEISLACAPGTDTIAVNTDSSTCAGSSMLALPTPKTRLEIDTNGDGTGVIVCASGACPTLN